MIFFDNQRLKTAKNPLKSPKLPQKRRTSHAKQLKYALLRSKKAYKSEKFGEKQEKILKRRKMILISLGKLNF